jgi:hypothetical protein
MNPVGEVSGVGEETVAMFSRRRRAREEMRRDNYCSVLEQINELLLLPMNASSGQFEGSRKRIFPPFLD